MTKLEEKLLAQIRARLEGLDVRASDKLAALLPALRKLTEGYAALGAAAKKTLAGLIPELAALIEAAEDALREILKASEPLDLVALVGLPVNVSGKLYNCAAVVHQNILRRSAVFQRIVLRPAICVQGVVGAVVDLPALIVVHLALGLPHGLPDLVADLYKLVVPVVGINPPQIDCFHRLTS